MSMDEMDFQSIDLAAVIADALTLVYAPCRAGGVDIDSNIDEALFVRGDRDALTGALVQLLNSIRSACTEGGAIMVTARAQPSIQVEISARGKKVDVASDDWMASGMGFWLARQVLAQHGGELVESSGGTKEHRAWVLQLPRNQ